MTTFLHYVVIPELVVSLIEEHMKVDQERALMIMEESTEIGDFFYREADDDDL